MSRTNQFKVFNYYGIKGKLRIILLGKVEHGTIKEGMFLSSPLVNGLWKIIEVGEIDFVNASETGDFIILVVDCETEANYNLLKSLRVYEEIVHIISIEQKTE